MPHQKIRAVLGTFPLEQSLLGSHRAGGGGLGLPKGPPKSQLPKMTVGLHFSGDGALETSDVYFLKIPIYSFLVLVW